MIELSVMFASLARYSGVHTYPRLCSCGHQRFKLDVRI